MPLAPAPLTATKSWDEMLVEARAFYYDIALSTSPMHLKALMALLGDATDCMLFGSDCPNPPGQAIKYFAQQLEDQSDVDAQAVARNAAKLFPRLQLQRQLARSGARC